MQRTGYLAALLFAFLLSSVWTQARAETISATAVVGLQVGSADYTDCRYGTTGLANYSTVAGYASDCIRNHLTGGTASSVTNLNTTNCPASAPVIGTTYSCTIHYYASGYTNVNVNPSGYSTGNACPTGQNWTLSGSNCTRPDCTLPQVRDPSNGVCSSSCNLRTGTSAGSSGYFDIGTDSQSSAFAHQKCYSSCYVEFNGSSPVATSLVSGVKHYYAQGVYQYTGDSCSGADTTSTNTSSVPSSGCGSGSTLTTYNGGKRCVLNSTGEVTASAEVVPAAAATTIAKTTSTSGSVTTDVTTITNSDGTTAVKTVATNATTGAVTTTQTGIDNSQNQMAQFCAVNPTASACQTVTPGTAAAVTGLYTADTSGRTFSSIFTAAKTNVQASGWYSAISTVFGGTVSTGGCTGLNSSVTMWSHTLPLDFTWLCGTTATAWYGYLSVTLILAAVWIAVMIAFV